MDTTDMSASDTIPPSTDIARVLLCGAQSTGKSTLMSDVIKHLEVQPGGEVGRSIMEKNGWSAESIDPNKYPDRFEHLQIQVLQKQRDIDQSFIQKEQAYMSDRGLDPLVYAAVYLGQEAMDRVAATELGQYCVQRVKNSLVFLITPHQEIARNDSVRMPANFERMSQYTDVMRKLLTQHKIQFEEVRILDRKARVDQVLRKVTDVWPHLIKKNQPGFDKDPKAGDLNTLSNALVG